MKEAVIKRALGHLSAAISQSIPADDKIIMDHVKASYELLCRIVPYSSLHHIEKTMRERE